MQDGKQNKQTITEDYFQIGKNITRVLSNQVRCHYLTFKC